MIFNKFYKNPLYISVAKGILFIFIIFIFQIDTPAQDKKEKKQVEQTKSDIKVKKTKEEKVLKKPPAKPGSGKKDVDKKKKKAEPKIPEDEQKKADRIIKAIKYDIHKERKTAIGKILIIRNKALIKKLGEILIDIIDNESDSEVKIKAINVAGELLLKDSVPALKKSLKDDSKDVRLNVIHALKIIGDNSVAPELIEMLKEEDLETNSTYTQALIETLGTLKATDIRKYAVDSIFSDKTTKNNREQFVLLLGKLGSKDSKEALLKLFKDEEEDKDIRAYAVNSLAKLEIKEAVQDINNIIKIIDSYPFKQKRRYYNLYIYCIAALARLGDDSVIPRLIDSLKSDNTAVRLRAIKLIKELKDKRTIDILKYKRDYDPSPKVQKAAEDALEVFAPDKKKPTEKGTDQKSKGKPEKEKAETKPEPAGKGPAIKQDTSDKKSGTSEKKKTNTKSKL